MGLLGVWGGGGVVRDVALQVMVGLLRMCSVVGMLGMVGAVGVGHEWGKVI